MGRGVQRGRVAALIAPLAAGASLRARAQPADDYPSKTVAIVVPFGAGGSADVYARVLGQQLNQQTGRAFIIENRPGAGALIGTQYAAKAPADGYTLLMMSNAHTVNESLLPRKPYELMRDFVAIAPVNQAPLVLVVRADLPLKNLPELIQDAKSHPGRLTYASSGTGTPYHMAGELFKNQAGIDIRHIPYANSGGARTDVMGGQVDMMFDAVSTMGDLIGTGKVRPIATTGKLRSSVLPDVPTMIEQGLPDYTATLWLGVMAPASTPRAVVEQLNARIARIVADPGIKATWARSGIEGMTMTPAAFTAYLERDIETWRRVVESAHIKVE